MLGGSMLRLLTTYVVASSPSEREHALGRANELAAEYGAMATRLGLTLAEATEAFLLFRNPVLETVHQWLRDASPPPRQGGEALSRVNVFMDRVLVTMTDAHERGQETGVPPTPPTGQ